MNESSNEIDIENKSKIKVTPGDFFLYLGMLITLYVSAVALITFLFAVIDISFPNDQKYYSDSTGAIAWTLSVFIVFYPTLIVLLSTAINGIIKNISKAEMFLRKWFIFLTLFITGLTIAIDLIVLVNFFLRGEELTLAFLLKIVSIILVAGIIFLFAFKDLKLEFVKNIKSFKIFRLVTSIVIAILIVVGLFLIGSPADLRSEKYDTQRINDMSMIQSEVVSFKQSKENLPANLEELNNPLRGFELPVDPVTKESYEYSVIDADTFELCATFETEQEDTYKRFYLTGFDHDAGRVCFERNVDDEIFPSYPKEVFVR